MVLNGLGYDGLAWVTKILNISSVELHEDRKNFILRIRDEAHQWKDQTDDIVPVLLGYYQGLFSTSTPDSLNTVLDQIPQVVTDDMNQQITGEFFGWEVTNALKNFFCLGDEKNERIKN